MQHDEALEEGVPTQACCIRSHIELLRLGGCGHGSQGLLRGDLGYVWGAHFVGWE